MRREEPAQADGVLDHTLRVVLLWIGGCACRQFMRAAQQGISADMAIARSTVALNAFSWIS